MRSELATDPYPNSIKPPLLPQRMKMPQAIVLAARMPRTGFEPARVASLPPQSSASASSATWARLRGIIRRPGGVSRDFYHVRGRCGTISDRFGGVEQIRAIFRERNEYESEHDIAENVYQG